MLHLQVTEANLPSTILAEPSILLCNQPSSTQGFPPLTIKK